MAPSHTTFSWHLYKTFTRTEDMFSVWKLHIGRWRESELSFAALVFGAFTSLVLLKCTGNAFLSLCSSSDQDLSCHINWPHVSDHYSAFCVFAPLLCAFLFTFFISRLSLLIPSLARSLPSLLPHLFLCHFYPCFSGESRARRQQGRGFVCLCVRIGSVCWYAAAEPREAQAAHSLRCHVLLLTADGSFLFPGIYLQAEVLIYVWKLPKVDGGSDFCLPTCSLCLFRCHLRASRDPSKDGGHPSPRS